ncbi:MAG TPA: VOC family protein [Acidimicrobiales bacterium]|nr:VOC family protein [Acidimicrobiales bacterium]
MTARLELVLDCRDPDRLAAFWAPALGYRLLGGAGGYRLLVPAEGEGPRLILQGVDEPKRVKNRMHLDIVAADIEGEAARLAALGARRTRADVVTEHDMTWIVMADPEDNEFCVCRDDGC